LPPHTQNGQKIRLNNCGLVQNNKIGDMIITVVIQIPENLNDEEISLYKKLEEISSNIREHKSGR
jgi:DnaJ-class molecular chaperone